MENTKIKFSFFQVGFNSAFYKTLGRSGGGWGSLFITAVFNPPKPLFCCLTIRMLDPNIVFRSIIQGCRFILLRYFQGTFRFQFIINYKNSKWMTMKMMHTMEIKKLYLFQRLFLEFSQSDSFFSNWRNLDWSFPVWKDWETSIYV